MRISVIGTGYVGLVTGVCLADKGNHVVAMDIDARKVRSLNTGECTIFEPGLEELLVANLQARRFRATTSLALAVRHAEIIFVAVGTPPREDGDADILGVEATVLKIARLVRRPTVLAVKSTVPPGTGDALARKVARLAGRRLEIVSNPEFLKEGAAVDDFQRPDRVIVGAASARAYARIAELYEPFVRQGHPILKVKRTEAEMIKYASNCALALRISFINQIANVCEKLKIDVLQVRRGMVTDRRIGTHFLYPGIGYGGSCFPKDVMALAATARKLGVAHELLDDTHVANERQKLLLVERMRGHFGGRLAGRHFAVWGLAFKPNTDDTREAPALRIIEELLRAGASLRVHDPRAFPRIPRTPRGRFRFFPDAYQAARGADALVICTEWDEFRSPDFDRLRQVMKKPVLFDGRNLYSAEQMRRRRFTYYSIGRPPVLRG